jgi:hypothetical protein
MALVKGILRNKSNFEDKKSHFFLTTRFDEVVYEIWPQKKNNLTVCFVEVDAQLLQSVKRAISRDFI